MYDRAEVTADDIAEIIAFTLSRPRHPRHQTRFCCDPPDRLSTKPSTKENHHGPPR
jgi:hypothetical protein